MTDGIYPFPRFLDAGETGLTIELGNIVSEDVNSRVIRLSDALAETGLDGIEEMVPTYRSLLVLYDPLRLSRDALCQTVLDLWPTDERNTKHARCWRVPVCYGGEHGVDLEFVAQSHGMTPEQLIACHAGAEYRVYMLGFAPGFSYLGGLPEAIHTSRRTDPRLKTPPRTISIGGMQAAISPPLELPSGWHLLGQTPVRTYDPRRASQPFLFEPGDRVRFTPISVEDYEDMCAAAEAGVEVAVEESAHG
ncbi:5-oxoprolinase subunit PxpB [Rhodoligotrophos defluvii]|uniref:5-oxoprolinase subunit PxpB n=1 Tax=Rhodoligotrophos defluvii TaxID=2561934 RepID=UPI0010C96208|nr:5-oxoprolinase subunit PxpB [Rhodoligotrophos defluvii]